MKPSTTTPQEKTQTGFDLVAHLHRQRAFSERTFGPGTRAKGVVAHIRKELIEIERDPSDVFEWIDVVLLALDGAWRAGYTPEVIAEALHAKQAKNEARKWPDWRTASEDDPIEHNRTDSEGAHYDGRLSIADRALGTVDVILRDHFGFNKESTARHQLAIARSILAEIFIQSAVGSTERAAPQASAGRVDVNQATPGSPTGNAVAAPSETPERLPSDDVIDEYDSIILRSEHQIEIGGLEADFVMRVCDYHVLRNAAGSLKVYIASAHKAEDRVRQLERQRDEAQGQRQAIRNEVIEECAKVCDVIGADWKADGQQFKGAASDYLAHSIRALKDQPDATPAGDTDRSGGTGEKP